jgi:16S rRNA G1207 methylase RsmC
MARKQAIPLSKRPVPEAVQARIRSPLLVVLGSPAEVVNLLGSAGGQEITCYQMDLYQSGRLDRELEAAGITARVVTEPDLWDLPPRFQTAVFLPTRGGERELKIDLVEQAFHVLKPWGSLVVWSPYGGDPFFPPLLKKVFSRVHDQRHGDDGIFWSVRDGDRPRRRHERHFRARIGADACQFISQPGTFSYGRLDEGARALAEVMEVRSGERIVDIGCGCGTGGIFATRQAGPESFVALVDSNTRATALAEINARANGVAHFQALASATLTELDEGSFDVALANPPYYAGGSISLFFVERAHALLQPGGRLYLVTRQAIPEEGGPRKHRGGPVRAADVVVETFGEAEAVLCRGYTVLCARKEAKGRGKMVYPGGRGG